MDGTGTGTGTGAGVDALLLASLASLAFPAFGGFVEVEVICGVVFVLLVFVVLTTTAVEAKVEAKGSAACGPFDLEFEPSNSGGAFEFEFEPSCA